MSEVTKQLRLQEWARQVDDWQASGMTQRNWCRVHGVGYDAFKYRKAKVERYAAELVEKGSGQIVPVSSELMGSESMRINAATGQTMEIHLEKATIRISNDVDPDLLRNSLEVLVNA